ncbi:MAG: prephenate dehydrogenase/arogenate dehydrogenase family protein [Acidimicrobiia bacterium]|nr:prephenate dehydrogenase/arogenate dehydrogenase family protein [Acidimicrobiia bacterium]
MTSRSAVVIGTGLIGGSIAAGLRRAGWHVLGYDADPAVAREAHDRGLVDGTAESLASAVEAADDLVVVAAPPKATVEILSSIDTDAVVMDVAGVKEPMLAAGSRLAHFAGTHPMAGRETSGPSAASAALFNGATWVVASESDEAAAELAVEVIESLGARPVTMDAHDHDRAVAMVSHLPQVVAGGLLASAADHPESLDLAAGSFRDLTRVGASVPFPWVEILQTNRAAVIEAIATLREHLATIEAAIVSEDDQLLTMLSDAREVRLALGSPVAQIRVALADRPGELARAGHAFEASGVDIRDIQMRHAPHGGGGVLTLSVRPGEEGALRLALEEEGLLVIP